MLVDGRRALLLPRPPAGVAGSVLAAGDCVHRSRAGRPTPGPLDVEDPEGLAQAAFVYPLPHRSTIRVAMPLAPERPRVASGVPRKHTRREPPPAVDTDPLAGGGRRAPRLAGPPSPRAAAGASRFPAPVGGRRQPGRPAVVPHRAGHHAGTVGRRASSFLEAASMVVTLDRYGFHSEAGRGPAGPAVAVARRATPAACRTGRPTPARCGPSPSITA